MKKLVQMKAKVFKRNSEIRIAFLMDGKWEFWTGNGMGPNPCPCCRSLDPARAVALGGAIKMGGGRDFFGFFPVPEVVKAPLDEGFVEVGEIDIEPIGGFAQISIELVKRRKGDRDENHLDKIAGLLGI